MTIQYGGGHNWNNYSGSGPANLLLNDWSGDVRVTLNNATIGQSGGPAIRIPDNKNNSSTLEGCSSVTFEQNSGSEVAPDGAGCPHP